MGEKEKKVNKHLIGKDRTLKENWKICCDDQPERKECRFSNHSFPKPFLTPPYHIKTNSVPSRSPKCVRNVFTISIFITAPTVQKTSSLSEIIISVQFSSATIHLCNPMDCCMPGFPVHHQLPEFTQTHVHHVGDAMQPSYPLLSCSPPTFNLFQHQGLFQWVGSSHQGAKLLEFQLQHQSLQWIFRTDFF